MASITINVPPELLRAWAGSPERYAREVRLQGAIELWRTAQVSMGKAAELAGVSYREFFDDVAALKIEWPMDEQYLNQELAFARSTDPGHLGSDRAGEKRVGGPAAAPGESGGDPSGS